jgi:hypothetical protein
MVGVVLANNGSAARHEPSAPRDLGSEVIGRMSAAV